MRRMAAMVMIAVLGAGCAAGGGADTATQPAAGKAPGAGSANAAPVAPITNVDPCAMRMHDLCGALLMHLAGTGQLPLSLAELEAGPGGAEVPSMTCPVSKKPYIYNPTGIYLADHRARLVLYDPAPSHAGVRWGIIGDDGDGSQPLVFRVIWLPESFFVLRPPQ